MKECKNEATCDSCDEPISSSERCDCGWHHFDTHSASVIADVLGRSDVAVRLLEKMINEEEYKPFEAEVFLGCLFVDLRLAFWVGLDDEILKSTKLAETVFEFVI